jgi:hypothetical protein
MQEDVSEEDWGMIYSRAHTQTINTSLRWLQYNCIMRTYRISPLLSVVLSKIRMHNNKVLAPACLLT